MGMGMQEGTLTVNFETGLYEILLTEFDETIPLFNGDEFSILIDGQWVDTAMEFSETDMDWNLAGVDSSNWGIGSAVRIELAIEDQNSERSSEFDFSESDFAEAVYETDF